MTTFDLIVPLAALAVGAVTVLYVKVLERRLDRETRERHAAE
jgi:hypothetical protein